MAFFGRTLSRLEELKKTVGKDPTSRQFLALSEEYRKAGKLREAEETLGQGLKDNPNYIAAHVALGRLHQQAQRFDDAILAYLGALKLDRDNLVAIRQLAECYLHKGDKVEAIKKFKLFRGLNPGDRDVEEHIQQIELDLQPPKPAPRTGPRLETWPSIPSVGFVSGANPERMPDSDDPGQVPPVSTSSALEPTQPFDDELQEFAHRSPIEPVGAPRRAATEDLFELTFERSLRDRSPAPAFEAAETPSPQPFIGSPAESTELSTAPLPSLVARLDASPLSGEESSGAAAETVGEELPLLQAGSIGSDSRSNETRSMLPLESPSAAIPAGPLPATTETLAEIYLSQGYVSDAREAYESLAENERDPRKAEAFRERAEDLQIEKTATPLTRLRRYAQRFPAQPGSRIEDLGRVLESLLGGESRIRAAVVTDREGLPLVSAGEDASATTMEALIAELTAFWKSVHRTEDEVGAGSLNSIALSGSLGGAVVTAVSPEYSLILHVDGDVPLGRIRYEASRTAGLLRPALG